jgi:hypothetical protein
VQVADELKRVLKPGVGSLLVRDYAAGDLAEQRLAAQGEHRRAGEHFYARGDGTCCLFFTKVRPSSVPKLPACPCWAAVASCHQELPAPAMHVLQAEPAVSQQLCT